MSATAKQAIGGIDHVVIVVDDLDGAAEAYRRLGFTLSPKGVHSAEMGSANHTIMLGRDYFELLGVTAPTARNARWREAIARGGGIAGIALATDDAQAARDHWIAAGLGASEVIRFARPVKTADGEVLEARFEIVTLDDQPDAGVSVFVCSQPTRAAVWLPELMVHENTAEAIMRVTIACPDLDRSVEIWKRILPASARLDRSAGEAKFSLGRQQILLRADRQDAAQAGSAHAIELEYAVRDMDRCRAALVDGVADDVSEHESILVSQPGTKLRFTA